MARAVSLIDEDRLRRRRPLILSAALRARVERELHEPLELARLGDFMAREQCLFDRCRKARAEFPDFVLPLRICCGHSHWPALVAGDRIILRASLRGYSRRLARLYHHRCGEGKQRRDL